MGYYYGYILKVSQVDKSIFKKLDIVGSKRLLGIFTLYKARVSPENIEYIVKAIQVNMADKYYYYFHDFYAHFIKSNELIIVFKNKIFRVTTDKSTWTEVIEYGKSLKIDEKQLDFLEDRFKE